MLQTIIRGCVCRSAFLSPHSVPSSLGTLDSTDASSSSQPTPISSQMSRESSSHLLLLRQKMNQHRSTQSSNLSGGAFVSTISTVSSPLTPSIASPALTQSLPTSASIHNIDLSRRGCLILNRDRCRCRCRCRCGYRYRNRA